jgi:putative ABC transport system permease protein
MHSKDLGFGHENIVIVPNAGGLANPEPIANEFSKVPFVSSVAKANGVIGFMNATNGVADRHKHNHVALNFILADYNFIPTLNMGVLEGRNFSNEFPSDTSAIIINEMAAEQLGLKKPIVGQQLIWDDEMGKTRDVTVIGVVKNFHFSSFHEQIKPFGFMLEQGNSGTFFLKLQRGNIQKTITEIEKVWHQHNPGRPFEYTFQDEHLQKMHAGEKKFQLLFSSFTVLAIIIACLGLIGLVTVLAESKTKEIGIRKILGASVASIIGLMSKDFIRLIMLALVIASPIAYYTASQWLDSFAYRIDIGWTMFALAGIVTVLIAFATVCLRSVGAAMANPVQSLKEE